MEIGGCSVETLANKTFWQDRCVFITGATGLVGGWTVKRLLELGAHVVALIRDWLPESELIRSGLLSRVTVVRGDIRDQTLLERVLGEHEIETVLHLAAQTIVGIANRNPISTFETNIQGTWCLLEACRRSPKVKQIINASSDKAYGDQEILPYNETTPLQGQHPYDVSKSCADLIASTYAKSYALPIITTRCGNFYGGGDLNWNRIVPGTIRSVLRNQAPVIRSDGQFIRDYFYVKDGARVCTLLVEELAKRPELKGEAFNFSNEMQVTTLALVDRILKLMNTDLKPVVLNEASNEIRHQYLSAEKARRVLNWTPDFSLDTALEETIAWYTKFLA
jgi:CDP-glucose 4,6-dehydratase